MDEAKQSEKMRVLNQQRCAEAIGLLYQTYVINPEIADERGAAIRAINKMIILFGGEDVISKIEAVPWTARLRESGEQDLINLEKQIRKQEN